MTGFATRYGIYSAEQREKIADIIKQVRTDKIETVRIGFADQHGIIRGKSFTAEQIETLFESGMTAPSSLLLKDLSHRTVMPVWANETTGLAGMAGIGDIILMPDPDRFKILPWLDNTAWIQADIYHKDGSASPLDTRGIARRAATAMAGQKLAFHAGLEIEAHVYQMVDTPITAEQIGPPGAPPEVTLMNKGYALLTEHYADVMEPIATIIQTTCRDLDIPLRSLEIEFGPSQIEFTCAARPGIAAGDDMVLLRSALRQVLARRGYHISFMCRPAIDGSFASGWHLHQSVSDLSGANLFTPASDDTLTPLARNWLAGLIAHAPAMTLFAVPTITGYKRYKAHSLAPERVSWNHDGRGALLRVLCNEGNRASRIENRGGEPAANPYLYLASQMFAGFDGMRCQPDLPPASPDAYATDLAKLPATLDDALQIAATDAFVRKSFGEIFIDSYTAIKRAEIDRFQSQVTDWEQAEYFAAF